MNQYEEWLGSLNREAYHDGEWQWEEDGFRVFRSYVWSAPGCHNSCGLLYYFDEEGRLDHVEGDPLSPVANGRVCARCLNMPEATNDPNRLKWPMKRAVEDRGTDKWERISWDEAYDLIVEKANYYKNTYGENSLAVAIGTGRNAGVACAFLGYAGFESPFMNMMFNIGHSCYLPRRHASRGVVGDMWEPDSSMGHRDRFANKEWRAPGVLIIWGVSAEVSNADGFFGPDLIECMQMGTKVILVDPKLTWWGARAEHFLQVRGGTDGALAMAMCDTIIKEGLWNQDFVNDWCYGFDQFAEAVAKMPAERAAGICDVDAGEIKAAARLFATEGPGTIKWGVALEHNDGDPMCTNLAILGMISLCGYWDIPGGCQFYRDSFGITHHLSEHILPADKAALNTEKVGPGANFGETRQRIFDWEDYKDNRTRMVVFQSNNSLGNACTGVERMYDIWREQLEFVVGIDVVMNPTLSALADVVLPCAMSIERDAIRSWWVPLRAMRKMTTYYEAKTDEQIAIDLVNRLHPNRFPMIKTDRDFHNLRLHDMATGGDTMVDCVIADSDAGSTGQTETFSEHAIDQVRADRWDPDKDFDYIVENLCGFEYDPWNDTYRKYEKGMLRDDKQPGFKTPTGRCELYSLVYQSWGMPPVPEYVEPRHSPVSTPELAEEYPFILNSGNRSFEYFHGEGKNQPTMRELHQWPQACINPRVAEKYGIKHGEWIWIESPVGRFKQQACVREGIRDDEVTAENGWWYPEDEAAEPTLFRVFDSNPNSAIDIMHVGKYGIGATQKSALVKIYPVREGDVTPTEQIVEKGGFPFQVENRRLRLAKKAEIES